MQYQKAPPVWPVSVSSFLHHTADGLMEGTHTRWGLHGKPEIHGEEDRVLFLITQGHYPQELNFEPGSLMSSIILILLMI